MTEKELDAIADVVAEKFEQLATTLRLEFTERLFELQANAAAPTFNLTPMGELYVNGRKVGDVRPVFREVVAEAMRPHLDARDD